MSILRLNGGNGRATLRVCLMLVFSAGALVVGSGQLSRAQDKPKVTPPAAASSSNSKKKVKINNPAKGVAPAPTPEVKPEVKIDPETYRIGIEDELRISVWQEPDLSMAVVVRPDGIVTLPLVNDVHVVGMKTTELQALLTEKFKPFVNEPQVTVIVQGIHSRKVYLVGQVLHQGVVPLNGKKTVMEVLAESGGLAPFAKGNAIYVLRSQGNKQVRLPFNYKKAIAGGNEKDNFELIPGDIIVVP